MHYVRMRLGNKGTNWTGCLIFTKLSGEPCDFEMLTFSNGYDLLTYGTYLGLHRKVVGF